jgi:hypothetical protein
VAAPPPASVGMIDALVRAAAAAFDAKGVQVTVDAYWQPDQSCLVLRAYEVKDNVKIGVARRITQEALVRCDEYLLLYSVRSLVREYEHRTRLDDSDAVAAAIELVGFPPEEVEAARLRFADGGVMLEVDLRDSDWQPDFEVELVEVLRLKNGGR